MQKKLKILQVISSANPTGGGPIGGALQLDRSFIEAGHQTRLVTLDDPAAPWLNNLPSHAVALGPSRGTYGYTPRLLPWLQREGAGQDAVIVHGLWQYHSVATRLALKRLRKPYFVFTHGMLDPWFKHRYPLKHLKKHLYWTLAEQAVLRDATAVLFTCEEERMLARQSFPRYAATEAVVGFGTTHQIDNPGRLAAGFLEHFPALQGRRLLLFLGRIHEKKGCDLAIEAFARYANSDESLHMVVAGPDDVGLQSKLEALAASRGVKSRITWTGMLHGDLKWGALAASEVFMLPSHQENFGIAVAEALAMGTPVLISNKVNIWREVEAEGAGIVGNDDVQGASECLEKWLALSSSGRQDMRGRAPLCFRRHFEIEATAQKLLALAAPSK